MNPFASRALSLSGPANDIVPVSPDDATDLADVAVALYAEVGGAVSLVTVSGAARTVVLADYALLPVGVRRVNATGTTALGIHALVIA